VTHGALRPIGTLWEMEAKQAQHISKWKPSKPSLQPETHIALIQRRGHALNLSSQEIQEVILDSLPTEMQAQVIQMCAQGRIRSWNDMQQEFLALTCVTHERTMHATLRGFATGMLRQLPSQSVTQHRLAFEAKLRTAVNFGCDAMIAHFFVAGLLPRMHMQPRCLHDYAGRPHDTLEKA
jgi:hypothetical protein